MNIDNIIFVCQKGELELQARILATSLRYKLGDRVRIVAAIPHSIDLLSRNTLNTLAALNVEVQLIKEPSFHQYMNHKGTPYLHGNKIDACKQFTIKGNNLLIDTDVVIYNTFPQLLLKSNTVAVTKARGLTCSLFQEGNELQLEKLYNKFGSNFNESKYCNSGVIFYNSESNFSELWFDFTHRLIKDETIELEAKFPWADQLSLSLIVALPDIDFNELSVSKFNNWHPGWENDGSNYIHHYHNFWKIFQSFKTIHYLQELEEYLKDVSSGSAEIFLELPIRRYFEILNGWHDRLSNLKKRISSLEKK